MNRITSIIYYIVVSFLTIITILTFVKLPTIIFVGLEDAALSLLFYIFSSLGILAFSINIIEFFLIKLGIYGIMRLESNELIYRIEQLENSNKDLKDEVFDVKMEVKYNKKRD